MNGARSTQVSRIAVMLALACLGVAFAAIAMAMRPYATTVLRAFPVIASLFVSSFMQSRTEHCGKDRVNE